MQIYNIVSVTQLKSHSETNLYKKEFQLNFNSIEK